MLFQLLNDTSITHPAAVAVIDGDRSISYGELDQASNRLARLLASHGIGRGARVGLGIDKSIEALVSIFAILKLGAAYVPIDSSSPGRRVTFIAQDCALAGMITTSAWMEALQDLPALRCIVLTDGEPGQSQPGQSGAAGEPGAAVVAWAEADAEVDAPVAPAPTDDISPEDLAYILYTSGSTGMPKGVMLSHRAACAFVDWACDMAGVGPGDRVSSHAPFHFDLSIFDIFVAVKAGAAIVLVPPGLSIFPRDLADFIARQGITVWYSVPSVLTQMVLRGELTRHGLPDLRAILFAGEVFPVKYLRQLMELVPHARYLNLYGPTETNVCTFHEVRAGELAEQDKIPIGRACCGDEAFVVKADGTLATPGEEGELWIAGPTLMSGYCGAGGRERTGLDALHGRAPVYRTGDHVVCDEHGLLWFVGRRDELVKVRGYRIELSAVEDVLLRHPDVEECAVIAVPDERTGSELKGFVVLRQGADASAPELRGHCADYLPRYMIPSSVVLCPALPRTSTGKSDKVRLQEMARGASAGGRSGQAGQAGRAGKAG